MRFSDGIIDKLEKSDEKYGENDVFAYSSWNYHQQCLAYLMAEDDHWVVSTKKYENALK